MSETTPSRKAVADTTTAMDSMAVASTRQLDGRRLFEAFSYILYPLVFIGLLILIWEIVTRAGNISKLTLPSPSAVALALVDAWSVIFSNIWVTLFEILVGYAIAIVLGVCIAVLMSSIPAVERTIYPLLVGSLVVPKIAIAPLMFIWFGFGTLPTIIIVALICFFPIVIDMTLGLKSVAPELITLVNSMGASRWNIFWKIRFINALPNLFVGLKVAMALAVVGAIVGEFVGGSAEGLGYLLLRSKATFRTDEFFAVIFVLTAVGVLLYVAVDVAERFVLRKHRSQVH